MSERAGVATERVAVAVMTSQSQERERRRWQYSIAVDGVEMYAGNDLEGCGSAVEMLDTFAAFLAAWDESMRYTGPTGENASLFPTMLWPMLQNDIEDLCVLARHLLPAERQ